MRLALVTAPVAPILTPAEIRARLGFGTDVTDAAINALVAAESQRLDGADGILGRALITQTWDLVLDGFPFCDQYRPHVPINAPDWERPRVRWTDGIAIPLPPLRSVVSITYRDVSGNSGTVDPALYRVVPGERGRVIPKTGSSWPATEWAPDAVTIRFTAGYGDAADKVPEPIRQAITLNVGMGRASTSRDPFLSREIVQGVGEFDYASGIQSSAMIAGQVERLIGPYRVGGGIS